MQAILASDSGDHTGIVEQGYNWPVYLNDYLLFRTATRSEKENLTDEEITAHYKLKQKEVREY
jgi:hypothetical protein